MVIVLNSMLGNSSVAYVP